MPFGYDVLLPSYLSMQLSHPKFPERFIQKVKYKDKWIVKKLSSLFRWTPQVGYLDSQSWFRDIWLFKHLTSWLLFLRIYHYSFPPLVSDCFLDRYITSHRTTPPRHQISNFDHLTVSLTILQDRKLIFPKKKSPSYTFSLEGIPGFLIVLKEITCFVREGGGVSTSTSFSGFSVFFLHLPLAWFHSLTRISFFFFNQQVRSSPVFPDVGVVVLMTTWSYSVDCHQCVSGNSLEL